MMIISLSALQGGGGGIQTEGPAVHSVRLDGMYHFTLEHCYYHSKWLATLKRHLEFYRT